MSQLHNMLREQERFEQRAVRTYQREIQARLLRDTLKEWRENTRIGDSVQKLFSQETSFERNPEIKLPFPALLFTDLLVATYLAGRLRAFKTARGKGLALAAKSPYTAAIAAMQRRLQLSDQELKNLTLQYSPVAITVTGELEDNLERRLESAVVKSLREGDHIAEGVKRFTKIIGDPSVAQTLFRTQTQLAYSAGRVSVWEDPAINSILWGFEYVTVGDNRVRENHADMHGVKLPKDDPFWSTNMPPNGYNCRCQALEIFIDEAPEETVTSDAKPDEGFAFNPGNIL